MTALDKGAADSDDEEEWLPFGVEDHEVAAFTAPWERVPSWFETSLWEWIARNLVTRNSSGMPVIRTQLLRRAELALHAQLPNSPAHHVGSTLRDLQDLFTSAPNHKAQLAFVDFLISDLDDDHLYVLELEQLLVEARSGWRVGKRAGKPALVKRLSDGVTAAATAAFKLGHPGKRLSTAWELAFALQPDPSNAYRMAVKAVEGAATRIVVPKASGGTLGTVIGEIAKGTWHLPHLREDATANSHDVLLSMLKLLWVGQHDRHDGPIKGQLPDDVTQEEAESAVMLAVTLVGWFETGKVQR